jgi:hypothetical protein
MMSFAWYLERWRSGLSAWNGMDGVWGLGRRAGEGSRLAQLGILNCQMQGGQLWIGNLDLASEFEGWVGTESKTGRRCWACMCLLC